MRILILFLLCGYIAAAQSINDYKYAIVPVRFEVQKSPHQYGLNELTRKYFEQLGFTVYFDDQELPKSSGDACEKLYVDVVGSNSMFRTELKVVLKDCRNALIYQSPEFKDRNKNNYYAYNMALRNALKSIGESGYNYTGPAAALPAGDTQTVILSEDFGSALTKETYVLQAKTVENGFELMDNDAKTVLRMYKTSQPEVFTATDGVSNGVVFKTGSQWIYEYYESGKKNSRSLNIRF